MRNTEKIIVFTGGGTGGHVFPAFPIVERIRSRGFRILWMGSKNGMEHDLVKREGIDYVGIPAGKWRRYFSLKNFFDLFRIMGGLIASWSLLRKIRPAALFSKGGFVSVPPVAAARFLGIPVLTHESDADLGLATRINLRLGAQALLSHESALNGLSPVFKSRSIVTGFPVRDDILSGDAAEGRRIAGLKEQDPMVLVLGGSLGAVQLNRLLADCLPEILDAAAVVHQVGKGNPMPPAAPAYLPRAFFHGELPHVLAAADLVIARGGAGTLWELAATATPAVIIPLDSGSRGDQKRNAAVFSELGLVVVLDGRTVTSDSLKETVLALLADKNRRLAMSASASHLPVRGAADRIAALLMETAKDHLDV